MPQNATYATLGSCTWNCNDGYYRSGNTCVPNAPIFPPNYGAPGQCGYTLNSCVSGVFYDANDVGNYAYWICVGQNGSAVSCSAYKQVTPPPAPSCGIGQYPINNSCQQCFSKPYNASYTTANSCDWACVGGYHREANTCVVDYVAPLQCGVGQYALGNSCQQCFSKPYNASYTTANSCDWACVAGHRREGNICVADIASCNVGEYPIGTTCHLCFSKPMNSNYSTPNTCDWTCSGGYHREGNVCVVDYVPTCGIGQYMVNNYCQSCFSKPVNSNYTTANNCDWACSAGHHREGNMCVVDAPICSLGQYAVNNYCMPCPAKPDNSSFVTAGSCDWVCASGFNRVGNACVSPASWGPEISFPTGSIYSKRRVCTNASCPEDLAPNTGAPWYYFVENNVKIAHYCPNGGRWTEVTKICKPPFGRVPTGEHCSTAAAIVDAAATRGGGTAYMASSWPKPGVPRGTNWGNHGPTLNAICRMDGYHTGAATNSFSWKSPGDNGVILFNGSGFARQNGRTYNNATGGVSCRGKLHENCAENTAWIFQPVPAN